MLSGFRLVPMAKKGELLPYVFCRTCSAMLRTISKKRYNNAPSADRDKIKALFWNKVDRVLQASINSTKP